MAKIPGEAEVAVFVLIQKWFLERSLPKTGETWRKEVDKFFLAQIAQDVEGGQEMIEKALADDQSGDLKASLLLPWDTLVPLMVVSSSEEEEGAATPMPTSNKQESSTTSSSSSSEKKKKNSSEGDAATASTLLKKIIAVKEGNVDVVSKDVDQEELVVKEVAAFVAALSGASGSGKAHKAWKKESPKDASSIKTAISSATPSTSTSENIPSCTSSDGALSTQSLVRKMEKFISTLEVVEQTTSASSPTSSTASTYASSTTSKEEDEEPEWQPKPEFEVKKVPKAERPKVSHIECREQNRRQDWGSWAKTLENKDERLKNGFLRTGDSWGDKAFEVMSKVKGKAFVKEMQKKKRASWRGGGNIDMGVNSVMFSDSD
ncbi:unnamed protein product [Amoebophrya sp. A25]|nr:unnamed protein product [Amoebophrya sp. A25]|eukprot:GSA25T00021940001.1